MSEWPTHAEELARKAMERIGADCHRFEAGELTADRLWVTADILSEVTQGLIPDDIWRTIYAVRQEAQKQLKGST